MYRAAGNSGVQDYSLRAPQFLYYKKPL